MAKGEKPEDPKKDNPEQSQRFVETAKALECDESDKAFERALQKLPLKKPPEK